MNIELLNEINSLLDDDVSLQDIASELSLQKSQIQLMLRMQKIVRIEFIKNLDRLELLEEENISLHSKNEKLIKQIDILKNEEIPEENISLKLDIDNLEHQITILELELSKYPNWLNLFFR